MRAELVVACTDQSSNVTTYSDQIWHGAHHRRAHFELILKGRDSLLRDRHLKASVRARAKARAGGCGMGVIALEYPLMLSRDLDA